MRISDRFILKPDFHNLGELGLDYKDLLTYITIRSFNNSKSKYCYPSYRAISKLSGLSTHFIGKSIKRLKDAGILSVWGVFGRRRKANWYMFDDHSGLSRIPFELLMDDELSTNEKATLILLFEYCKFGFCSKSIAEIADKSGVSYRVLNSHYQPLLLKGYIVESIYENPLTNTLNKYFEFTNKLKWNLCLYHSLTTEPEESSIDKLMNIILNPNRKVIIVPRPK